MEIRFQATEVDGCIRSGKHLSEYREVPIFKRRVGNIRSLPLLVASDELYLLFNHFHDTCHQSPVTWESTDVRVVANLVGNYKA
jgi:hypothetical protein